MYQLYFDEAKETLKNYIHEGIRPKKIKIILLEICKRYILV